MDKNSMLAAAVVSRRSAVLGRQGGRTRCLSLLGGGGMPSAGQATAKEAASAAREAGSHAPGLEVPWRQGLAVYRQLLRSVHACRA